MKKYLILGLLLVGLFGLFSAIPAEAARVRGYYKPSTGTYVQPYYRSSSNNTRWDNYSTRGNYNPYTGKRGYTSPYKSYRGW